MGLIKRLTKSDGFRAALCWLGAHYIRFVHATTRWTVEGDALPRQFWDEGKPFILAFWHGRILMMPYCWRDGQPINMLISQHRDGQIIARTVGHFGIETISGSTSKGGAAALRAMLKSLKTGTCVGITPDGPRGPRMRSSEGIVQVARMAGVPVLACSYATRRRKILGSWDRFSVALPFGTGVFLWSGAMSIAAKADAATQEAFRQEIEDTLNRLTAEADQRMGHDPVQPAALPLAGTEPPVTAPPVSPSGSAPPVQNQPGAA